jgi:Ser/Thr protein kinase RdoA (MazF antagonist)
MTLSLGIENVAAVLAAWPLPAPVAVSELGAGFAGETWLIEAGDRRYVAKLCYDAQATFETGLRIADIVERHGIPSGAPLRTSDGALSVLVAHPPGHQHPLALLHFVPGRPLDVAASGAQHVVGRLLGRVHRILHDDGTITGPGDALFTYLTESRPEVFSRYPWLRPLLLRAVDNVRSFGAAVPVTYDGIVGDNLEILRDETTGQVGIVDWHTAGRGPLLFDLALAVNQFRRAGIAATGELVASYAAEAPVTAEELVGLDDYLVLLWARQARFWAWRLVHKVTRGDPNSADGDRKLTGYRQKLEQHL